MHIQKEKKKKKIIVELCTHQYNSLRERLDRAEKCLQLHCAFFSGFRALFTRSASTSFSKKNFKTGSHGIIHTFKNYFVTVFLVFSNKQYPNSP